jgi:hypothetical protein
MKKGKLRDAELPPRVVNTAKQKGLRVRLLNLKVPELPLRGTNTAKKMGLRVQL